MLVYYGKRLSVEVNQGLFRVLELSITFTIMI